MRILHVIPSFAARDGGPPKAVIEMCRSLLAAAAALPSVDPLDAAARDLSDEVSGRAGLPRSRALRGCETFFHSV